DPDQPRNSEHDRAASSRPRFCRGHPLRRVCGFGFCTHQQGPDAGHSSRGADELLPHRDRIAWRYDSVGVGYRQPCERSGRPSTPKPQPDAGLGSQNGTASMSTVIKIGGALLENPKEAATAIRRSITEPSVVVHGGGVQISRILERMNVESRFVDGLRVTDSK